MGPNVLLRDQIEEFIEDKTAKRSPATADQYRFVLKQVLLPWAEACGITEADQIDAKQMDRFTAYLRDRKKPLAVATVQTYVRGIRIFLGWWDVPKGRYEAPRAPQRLRDTLSRQEIDQLERMAGDERDRLIIRLLADTGIRASELLGLRPQDLRENTHARRYLIRVIGKGNKEREIVVDGALYRRLRNHAAYNGEYLFNGKRRRNGEVDRLTRSGLFQLVRNISRKAGMGERKVHPHTFRFSYITHMRRKNVDAMTVMRAVGHSSLKMISEIYDQTTAEDGATELLNALK